MERAFLTLVGVVYVALGLWCALSPEKTAHAIGLRLDPGSGQSEYVTVYGGIQVALGALFLLPWLRPEHLAAALLTCVVVHASLVVFRSLSFVSFTGIGSTTRWFALSEWVVFLLALALWLRPGR